MLSQVFLFVFFLPCIVLTLRFLDNIIHTGTFQR